MSGDDSKLVQLRVPKHLLDKWTSFCKQNAVPSRTAFIIQACNHYMLNFNLASKKEVELADLKEQYSVLSEQMSTILQKMENTLSDEEITREDPKVKDQILNYLEDVGSATSDRISKSVGVKQELLLDILTEMKKVQKLITVNKDHEWSVKKK
ncbi:MAG: hypothetical protein ACTSUE_01365 [Promethearchaeota archaeon]